MIFMRFGIPDSGAVSPDPPEAEMQAFADSFGGTLTAWSHDMRGVNLLVRLARHDLEERRSDLGCISQARDETEAAIDTHDETVVSETDIALADPTVIAAFGAWASHSARGRAKLQDRFQELDVSADAARENLRATAAQVRRLEIVLETARVAARRLAVRRADNRADERELARAELHNGIPGRF